MLIVVVFVCFIMLLRFSEVLLLVKKLLMISILLFVFKNFLDIMIVFVLFFVNEWIFVL